MYARVVLANKDMEPELACMSARNKAEGYGELTGGYMIKSSISLAYRYLLLIYPSICLSDILYLYYISTINIIVDYG